MAVDTITHDDIIEEEPEDVDDLENDSEAEQDEFEFQEKIIIPSPKVSIDENDIPIIVNNKVRTVDNAGYFYQFLTQLFHRVNQSSRNGLAVTALLIFFQASFEEKILQASPDVIEVQLLPCDICGRKFNSSALERHIKVFFSLSKC